jgi:hypothetical protein
MEVINIKAYTSDDQQITALKAFLKSLKIKFEVSTEIEYDQKFVDMIKEGQKDIAEGKGVKMSLEELKKLCN